MAVAAASAYEWVTRPRVRLSLTGAILVAVGGLISTNSVWTLPLVIVGAVMLVVAWIGSRLDGRFAIEWGQTGTELAFRATIRAAHHAPLTAIRQSSGSRDRVLGHEHRGDAPEVIDGEAHTVEIDVEELKALIAAVETAEAGTGPADAPPQDIRIRRVPNDQAHPARAAG